MLGSGGRIADSTWAGAEMEGTRGELMTDIACTPVVHSPWWVVRDCEGGGG